MIKRYTRPEMGALFTDQAKYDAWLAVELAVCNSWAKRGEIPRAAYERIKKKARYDLRRIEEIEQQVQHDVISFTTSVGEYIGADSAFFHKGLTSNDIVDTAQGMLLKQAGRLLETELLRLKSAIGTRALEHKFTPCIGRTHGVHAEPTTFGLRLLVWYDELARHEERLALAIDQIAVGKLSGAVGNFANIPPLIEEEVLKELGLLPEPVSSQVVQRDRHAQFVCTLAGIGATLEKIALNLRALQRTELGEVQEPFAPGQKGSSAMPHKKNPILLERVTGLSRVLRGYAMTALENVALWDERDISHSGAERIILADSCIVLDYMLAKLSGVVEKLEINAERMKRNVFFTKGLVFSQRALLALAEAGLSREQAYALVQRNAMRCWDEGTPLMDALLNDREVRSVLKPQQISELFSLDPYMAHVEEIFARAGLSEAPKRTTGRAAPAKPAAGSEPRAARGRGRPKPVEPVSQGPVQNILERPSDYYEPVAITYGRAPSEPVTPGDETLGDAEYEKKLRRRGGVRVRRSTKPVELPGGTAPAKPAPAPRTRRAPAAPRTDSAPAGVEAAAPAKPRSPARRGAKPKADQAAPGAAVSAAPAAAGGTGPVPDGGADSEQAKKKRRRGTRGGRRHKKNGAVAGVEGQAGEPSSDDSYVD